MFDSIGNSEKLNVAHAGVATIENARTDNPRCSYETGMSTNTPNSDNLQTDQGYKHSTSKLCLEVSQQTSGSGQSTSSCAETEECLDITQENIRMKQENDAVLKHLLQWKRDDEKPAWVTVVPFCRELKAYWHESETIELKDNFCIRNVSEILVTMLNIYFSCQMFSEKKSSISYMAI